MGLGFLAAGALGGLGAGLSSVGEDMRKNDNADAAMGRQQALETWKLQTMQAYKIADEQRAQAPLNRLNALVQAESQKDVPVATPPVSSLPADSTLATGGLVGNYGTLVAQAQNLPEADRAPYLAQLQSQRDRAQADAVAANAGKTRKMTADEALDSGMNKAKTGDLQAYAAGKPLVQDKTITVPDGASVISRDGKMILDGSGSKDARISLQEDRRDERSRQEREAGIQRTQMVIDGQQERLRGNGNLSSEERKTYTTLLSETGRQMLNAQQTLSTLRKNPLYSIAKPGDPQYQEMQDIKDQISTLGKQREAYASQLAGTSGAKSAADTDGSSTASDPSAGLPPATVVPGATMVGNPKGLVTPGNIDITNRPKVKNADGSTSTVRTISIGTDEGEVLIPTVVGNKVVSDKQAIAEYERTGKHLGIFKTPEEATAYAESLHNQQATTLPGASSAGDNRSPKAAKPPLSSFLR